MKVSKFVSIPEEKPFWGVDDSGDPEVLIKRHDQIYSLGWDVPLDPDSVEFIEFVKPVGWKPPTEKQVQVASDHKRDIERSITQKKEKYLSKLDELGGEKIVSIYPMPEEGVFRIEEQCDGYYKTHYTKKDLLALADEIIELANGVYW